MDPILLSKIKKVDAARIADKAESAAQIAFLLNGYQKLIPVTAQWKQQGWDGAIAVNITNATSTRSVYTTLDSTFSMLNTNEELYDITAYRYDDIGTLLAAYKSPAFDLPAGKYKFDIRNPDSTVNFYVMTDAARNIAANTIMTLLVGKINIPYLDAEISRLDGSSNLLAKPCVIFDFDWYSDMYDKRYQILKGEYGYNATFSLDEQTTVYNLDATLTRAEFNTMIESGWDYGLYDLVGGGGTTEAGWITGLEGILTQKASMGIFNPVIYNTPNNATNSYISNAVKATGFKMQRCETTDNLLKASDQFKTGTVFMTTNKIGTITSKLETCVANNYGLVLYTHLVIDDSVDINDGGDSAQGHCYETSFRVILDLVKGYVDAGQLEVLTARQFYEKYHPYESAEYDYNRSVKMQNFILSKITI